MAKIAVGVTFFAASRSGHFGAGWLVPEGDSATSIRAAAAVQALMLQLLNSDDHGASGSAGESAGGHGGGIGVCSEHATISGVATAKAKPPISPGELAALQKSADRWGVVFCFIHSMSWAWNHRFTSLSSHPIMPCNCWLGPPPDKQLHVSYLPVRPQTS